MRPREGPPGALPFACPGASAGPGPEAPSPALPGGWNREILQALRDKLPILGRPPYRRGRLERSTDGLGVGLYIAQQIAAAHGGQIEVTSSRARGTALSLSLPLAPTQV